MAFLPCRVCGGDPIYRGEADGGRRWYQCPQCGQHRSYTMAEIKYWTYQHLLAEQFKTERKEQP